MSACLSSGGSAAAYSFELEKIKSPPSSSTTTRATSPSSTITESSNSPLAISTRKPRTQRKRPNQSYNEAATLLSTAYPNIFSPSFSCNHLYTNKKTHHFYGFDDEAELILPFESVEEPDFLFLPTIQVKSEFFSDQKEVNSGVSITGDESEVNQFEFSDEFDAEYRILDEETEEGIDSIMGKLEAKAPGINPGRRINRLEQIMMLNKGFKFPPLGLGLRNALRGGGGQHNDAFHTVDFDQISPRIQTVDEVKKTEVKKSKKKKKKVTAAVTESKSVVETSKGVTEERSEGHPMLRLDYDGVLEAWSDKATPFGDESLSPEATGADGVNARLAQIDLFGDSGMREASVLRYKEKRQTRLFSKKIRYQVRKVNADQRPRVKVSSPTLMRG
ncbi:unnamed protein product [Eruca vesicaria subsp. sativa]|uniref:CCT domain-containing protein n=1 Tax=Eruca vesicaria subsp. sativa TaxID=29727 RepID=A0ABC8JX77_ERUVS|nr:unnamed protein product [Eruca vesicaria subsp. sativa]